MPLPAPPPLNALLNTNTQNKRTLTHVSQYLLKVSGVVGSSSSRSREVLPSVLKLLDGVKGKAPPTSCTNDPLTMLCVQPGVGTRKIEGERACN